MLGEICPRFDRLIGVFVDQLFLHDIGTWVGQSLREIGGFLASKENYCRGIGRQDTVSDDGFNLSCTQLIGIFDESQVVGTGTASSLERGLESAVDTVG